MKPPKACIARLLCISWFDHPVPKHSKSKEKRPLPSIRHPNRIANKIKMLALAHRARNHLLLPR